jgi:hypothetical protein
MSDFKFQNVQQLVDMIQSGEIEPNYGYLGEPLRTKDFDYRELNSDRPVSWIGGNYIVAVPVENIDFMEGNQWYLGHAAAIYEGIQDGSVRYVEAPVARVYRVKASDVKSTQRYESDGELEYQTNMLTPWESSDIREYHAQLIDGNHRALAAIAAGASHIYVYVSPNERENIYKKDWEKQ